MYSCWVYIAEDNHILVHMFYTQNQLSECRNYLVKIQWSFAKTLPRRDVVRCFCMDLEEALGRVVIYVSEPPGDVKKVWVL